MAVGAHPTGMLSCFFNITCLKQELAGVDPDFPGGKLHENEDNWAWEVHIQNFTM